MLALFSSDQRQLAELREALPANEPLVATDDWGLFERTARVAECAIVTFELLGHQENIRRLAVLKVRCSRLPIILVLRRDADNALCLKDVSVDDVIWVGERQEVLRRAVGRACTRNFFHLLATTLQSATHLPRCSRDVLAYACRSEPPLRSVAELASDVGCDRTTVWRRWREAVGETTSLRLEDFLDWLLLLRAVGRKGAGCGWAKVAAELSVHEHTLGRLARRLAGSTLRDLESVGWPTVVAIFRRRILHSLIGVDDCSKLE